MQKDSLSQIERGLRFPHAEHFMLLVERYGVPGYSLGDFFDQRTARLLDLKNQILSVMQFMELGHLPELLFLFRKELDAHPPAENDRDIFSRQFWAYAYAWFLFSSTRNTEKFLNDCTAALKMTQPQFDDGFDASEAFLVQNELMILNSIASLYAYCSMEQQALILFEQLLIRLNRVSGSHPIHFRNIACFSHNAALLECKHDPALCEKHLDRAMNITTQYGGIWTGCQIWRTQIQLARHLHPYENHSCDDWFLKPLFLKSRPKYYSSLDFETFMKQRDFLQIY